MRVGHAGGDRRAALRQAGQRADEVGRQAGDEARPLQHRVDVPRRMVVGEDRPAQILLGAGRLEVARGGEDRVDGVVGVLAAVLVGVDAVGAPARGHELHPALRAGRRDVEVAAVVGLDLVDRRQDLPRHAVLDPRRLVDRQQKRRDREVADEEVRDPRRRRGRGQRAGQSLRPRCTSSAVPGSSSSPPSAGRRSRSGARASSRAAAAGPARSGAPGAATNLGSESRTKSSGASTGGVYGRGTVRGRRGGGHGRRRLRRLGRRGPRRGTGRRIGRRSSSWWAWRCSGAGSSASAPSGAGRPTIPTPSARIVASRRGLRLGGVGDSIRGPRIASGA